MLIVGFPAEVLGTNCYVIAPGRERTPGQECLVVDPGIGVMGDLTALLREQQLTPRAIVLTHGHLDHVHAVPDLVERFEVPVYLHADDHYRLHDPYAGLGPELAPVLEQQFGSRSGWRPPSDVRPLGDAAEVDLLGLHAHVDHAPGHTEGSVLVRFRRGDLDLSSLGAPAAEQVCLSGDVLFAGSIGRTDLPGGDPAAMQRSLRTTVLAMADDTAVLPGHGPATSMQRERVTNPFLGGL